MLNELRDWPELAEDQRKEFVRMTQLCQDLRQQLRKKQWWIAVLASISMGFVMLVIVAVMVK